MSDLEQDLLIERAKSRNLEDKIFERESQLRKMTAKFDSANEVCKNMKMDMQNILELCIEFQERGPFEVTEILRRVLVIKALVEHYISEAEN